MNRLKKVAGGRDEVLATYDYDGAGQIRKLRYGNGVQTEYSYQDDGDIASLVTVREQGQVLLNFDYAYDLVGNRLKKEFVQGTEIYHYNAKTSLPISITGKTRSDTSMINRGICWRKRERPTGNSIVMTRQIVR